MSELYTSFPVQYLIETKSDWTRFSVIEDGFWWSDIKVECLKGEDKLAQDVVFCDRIIKIRKNSYDRSLVKIRVTCRLNVYEDHLTSNIHHLIEKGNIEHTKIRISVKGKEIDCLENEENVKGNPQNPKEFSVSMRIPSKRGIRNKVFWFSKVFSLLGSGYAIILLASLLYCYFLSLDFLEFARTKPEIIILGGTSLLAPLFFVAFRRNWI
jgi:hypothetical protein